MESVLYKVVENIPIGQVAPSIWDLIASGYYSDVVFEKWTPFIGVAIKNNLALLLLLVGAWMRFSNYTKNKWDNKLSSWIYQKLTRTKKENKNE